MARRCLGGGGARGVCSQAVGAQSSPYLSAPASPQALRLTASPKRTAAAALLKRNVHRMTLVLCGLYLVSMTVLIILFREHASGMQRLRASGLLTREVASLSLWALLLESHELGSPFPELGISVNDTARRIGSTADAIDELSHYLVNTFAEAGLSRADADAQFNSESVLLREWVPTANDYTSGFYREHNGTAWDGIRHLLEAARDLSGRGAVPGGNLTSAQFRFVVDNGPSALFDALLAAQHLETGFRLRFLRSIDAAALAMLVINALAGAAAAVLFYQLLKGARSLFSTLDPNKSSQAASCGCLSASLRCQVVTRAHGHVFACSD